MSEENKQEVSGREQLYQEYLKSEGREAELAPPKEEPKPEEKTAQPPVEAEINNTPEPEVPAEPKKEEKPQEKFVPKQALDEERSKRKKLKEERDALEAKLRQYEKQPVAETEVEPITDYDKELHDIKRKLKTFEAMEAQREELAKQEQARREHETREQRISRADIDLAEEGYPGFKFMVGAVATKLQEIYESNPDEAAAFDNPDGWKKIFKESVYPEFKRHQEEINKKVSLEKKVELKKEANLATSTGKAPQKKEEDNPNEWSEERKNKEYERYRQGASRNKPSFL